MVGSINLCRELCRELCRFKKSKWLEQEVVLVTYRTVMAIKNKKNNAEIMDGVGVGCRVSGVVCRVSRVVADI